MINFFLTNLQNLTHLTQLQLMGQLFYFSKEMLTAQSSLSVYPLLLIFLFLCIAQKFFLKQPKYKYYHYQHNVPNKRAICYLCQKLPSIRRIKWTFGTTGIQKINVLLGMVGGMIFMLYLQSSDNKDPIMTCEFCFHIISYYYQYIKVRYCRESYPYSDENGLIPYAPRYIDQSIIYCDC